MKVEVNPGETVMYAPMPAKEGDPVRAKTYTEGKQFDCTDEEAEPLLERGVVSKVAAKAAK